jgi:predicted amidophosphoribosyltransferase
MEAILAVLSKTASEKVAMWNSETKSKQNISLDIATQLKCPRCTSIHSKWDNFCGKCGKNLHENSDSLSDEMFDALQNTPIFRVVLESLVKHTKEKVESGKWDEG